eukprot:scaffold39100_cov61-Phaeocystis_antarctica.AAC.2
MPGNHSYLVRVRARVGARVRVKMRVRPSRVPAAQVLGDAAAVDRPPVREVGDEVLGLADLACLAFLEGDEGLLAFDREELLDRAEVVEVLSSRARRACRGRGQCHSAAAP